MRILIVNKFLYPNGGSETYIFKIGQELVRMGHEVQYFGMEHEGRIVGNRAGVYTKPVDFHGGSKLDKLSMPFKILYSNEAKADMKKVLRDFQPDVVHLNNINFQLTPSVIEAVREYEQEQQGSSPRAARRQVTQEMRKTAVRKAQDNEEAGTSKANHRIKIIYTAHDAQWVCPNHLLRIPSTGEICTRCIDGDYANCAKHRCVHNSRLRSVLGEKEAELYQKRGTYRLVDTIVSPSQFLADVLAHNPQLQGRIVVLHNFYDGTADTDAADGPVKAQEEQSAQAEQSAHAETEPDPPAPGYVLYFGRYTKEKGVETLLKVCRRLPDIPFVFAGRGDLEAEVDAAAGIKYEDVSWKNADAELPDTEGVSACGQTEGAAHRTNVRNVGFRNAAEIRKLIRGAAFVVFPSEWLENGPFSVIESIMNGTPVVGSRLGGTPELIAEGETGRLFEAGNAAELEEIIRSLYYNRADLAKLREGCRKTMRGEGSIRFDTLHEYCEKLVRIYRG